MKYFLLLFIALIVGCASESKQQEEELVSTGDIHELDLYKEKQKEFKFILTYEKTEIIDGYTILNFKITVLNNYSYSFLALVMSCPNYDHFEILETFLLEFYPPNYCFSTVPIYREFPPGKSSINLQCKLIDPNKSIEGKKIRMKFNFSAGVAGIKPIDMGARLESPAIPMISNYLILKDEYKVVSVGD